MDKHLDAAEAILRQIDALPKRWPVIWQNLHRDTVGRYVVDVEAFVSVPTIRRWFRATAAYNVRVQKWSSALFWDDAMTYRVVFDAIGGGR